MQELALSLAVKWWALLIGVVVHFITGMLWYGPFFGKLWMKLIGTTEQEIRESGGMGPALYGASILTSLVSTYIMAVMLNWVNAQSIAAAMLLALLIWLGFSAAPVLNSGFFERRPIKLFCINSFHHLTNLLIISVILQVIR